MRGKKLDRRNKWKLPTNLARNFPNFYLLDSSAAEGMRRRSLDHRAWRFPKIPQPRGMRTIVKELKRVLNLIGQENDGRVETASRVNQNGSLGMPTICLRAFLSLIVCQYDSSRSSLSFPVFSPAPLIIPSIYEAVFPHGTLVRHPLTIERANRRRCNAFRTGGPDESN